ncbi:MAG: DUF4163 domain-containing protein, partial [Rhizomicrobium sp.]
MRLALAPIIAPVIAVALAAAFATPAFAKLPVKTVKIAEKHKEYEVDVAYPKTGNETIDEDIASWAKLQIVAFKDDAAGNDGDSASGPYQLGIDFQVARNDDKMFAVVFTYSTYEGGAHPNTVFQTMNFLMPDGWQVYLQEIFTEAGLKKISKLATADLDKQLIGPDGMGDKDWIARGAGPVWDNFGAF